MPLDQIQGALGVLVHSSPNLRIDGSAALELEWRGSESLFPLGEPVAKPEVGVKKMSAGAQYAGNLLQKAREVWIAVGGFDVDHRVKGVRREREFLGVALNEGQTAHLMALLTKTNCGGIQVQGTHGADSRR